MTGDGDRLDGIVELLAASDFDRIGHIDNDDVRWLCRELRDAQAENERINGSRSCYVAAGLALERERDELRAEVESLRAKLAAVQEWAMVSEIAAPPLDWAALGRALAAAEQDEPKREQDETCAYNIGDTAPCRCVLPRGHAGLHRCGCFIDPPEPKREQS